MLTRDVELPKDRVTVLLRQQHISFIDSYARDTTGFEQTMVEYLRMSGIYWCLNAVDAMKAVDECPSLAKQDLIDFIMSCFTSSGGFSPSPGHDPHILYTLTAIQSLVILDSLSVLKEEDVTKIVSFVSSLQETQGTHKGGFKGDIWGEVDLRFSMCSVSVLTLLQKTDAIDCEAAASFVRNCSNVLDGGFGSRPGSESHAALVYCGVGTLSLLGRLDIVDADSLSWWLSERQLPTSGGLNGRPEKLPDVCYSWWVLASLKILGRLNWIQRDPLIDFILSAQDQETGGFADRPGDVTDPFHTCFGVAALSLLIHDSDDSSERFESLKHLKIVNPVLCMSQESLDRLGVKIQMLHV